MEEYEAKLKELQKQTSKETTPQETTNPANGGVALMVTQDSKEGN